MKNKKIIKWTVASLATFAVILGLWKISGTAMGSTDSGTAGPTKPVVKVIETNTTSQQETTAAATTEQAETASAVASEQSSVETGSINTPTPTAAVISDVAVTTVTPADASVPTVTPTHTDVAVTDAIAAPTVAGEATGDTITVTQAPLLDGNEETGGDDVTNPTPTPELAIKGITATYIGEDRIVTNPVIKTDIEAYIIYTWDSIEPELIPASSLTLKPGTVENVGENVIEVWYDDYMTTITVNGLERTLVSFDAEYTGDPVYTGSNVDRAYIKAVATYNDDVKEDVSDYTLLTTKVNNVGVNAIKITFGGLLDTIYVDGITEEVNRFKDFPIDSEETTRLTMLVSNESYANSIYAKVLDPDKIRNAVNEVVSTDKYLGFEISYEDPDAINEFPIYSRIIRPDDYDPDAFAVYYTPNRKTIMAKVDGEYIDDEQKQYVFYIYEPGSYVMVEEISHELVTSINVEKTYYKMKVNRNVSLEPVVLPKNADNTEVTYTSTDTAVAVVTKTGKVTSTGVGECDIVISACDESGISTTVHITVVE